MLFRILFFLLLHLSVSAASIVLSGSEEKISGFSLSYRYDETSSLSIDEVAGMNFTETIPSQFALGYREGAAWFKVTIENRGTESDFVLYFTEPFWASFDLYEPVGRGWKRHSNGLLTPMQMREIQDANPAFALTIEPGSSKTYYIRGKTINAQIGAFELYRADEFFRPSRLDLSTFYLFYSGVLSIIAILNLFLLVEMRERIYAYYIGYVLAFIVFVTMFNASYLYAGFAPWNQGLHVVGTVVLAFMTLFSKAFLELGTYFPRMDRLFKFFAAAFLVFGFLIHFCVPHATLTFNILSALFVTLLLVLAIKTWLLGKIKIRYYLIALIIYMPTMGLMVLTFNGLLENTDFTRYAFLFGALTEIIFFSLILANRFHAAKDDTIRLQKELLEEKEKNQECLEHEIQRQRCEIQEKNAILFHQSRHAAMGEMISMIAHQWRQPLNTLALINQDLYVKYKLGLCNEQNVENSHDQINDHLQYMSKTIDDFRDYYRDDKLKQPEDIGEIVRLSLRLCDVYLKYAKIKTDLTVATQKKGYLPKNEMIQMLMNLIKNAYDAIIEKKTPSGRISIRVEEAEGSIRILICDNGGGIPDAIAAKIFEPYFSTKSENGTGLGLYMSRSIVEEHCGGSLSFYNTDEGACFSVAVPVYEETEPSGSPAAP